MAETKIEPHRATKPFQLVAVRMAACAAVTFVLCLIAPSTSGQREMFNYGEGMERVVGFLAPYLPRGIYRWAEQHLCSGI